MTGQTSDESAAVISAERQYGEAWATRYDAIFPEVDDVALDFLEARAGPSRRALELAVGTGRVALPLARRGLEVTGVDLSEAMVAKLRAKPDSEMVKVVVGDMVEVPVEGLFPLVFIAFNSIFAISSQERQVECFHNVSLHLEPSGRFILECFVPDMNRFDAHHRHESERSLESGLVSSEVSIHYPATQQVDSQILTHHPDGSQSTLPVRIRYAWPAELDLMAKLAGLDLEDRFEWYDGAPFNSDSGRHVSVYRKP